VGAAGAARAAARLEPPPPGAPPSGGWSPLPGPPPNHPRYSVAGIIVVVVLGLFVLIGLIGASADSGGCPDKTAA
jgi:hypothetical protein